MPYLFQYLFEEIMNDLKNLKTDKDKDRVIIDTLIRMTNSLSGDVYNNNINMNFLNKIEIIKQYRQSVMYEDNVDFFKTIIQKFLKFKVLTMAVVYGNDYRLLGDIPFSQMCNLYGFQDRNLLGLKYQEIKCHQYHKHLFC